MHPSIVLYAGSIAAAALLKRCPTEQFALMWRCLTEITGNATL